MNSQPQYRDVTPNPLEVFDSYRSWGYTLSEAFADLIDNCISNGARNVRIFAKWCGVGSFLTVRDDGAGISDERLDHVMTFAGGRNSARSVNDLGRFGCGLKTASLSQCTCFSVISKCHGEENCSIRTMDRRIVESQNRHVVLNRLADDCPDEVQSMVIEDRGTIVVWQNLDRLLGDSASNQNAFWTKINHAKQDIGVVFHRFIETKRIKIYVNDQEVSASDPTMAQHRFTTRQPTLVLRGGRVRLGSFIVPHPSSIPNESAPKQSDQGIYVYRNDRLISAGKWHRMASKDPAYSLARVTIDLSNETDDEWKINIMKNTVEIPSSLRAEIDEYVKSVVFNAQTALRNRTPRAVSVRQGNQSLEYIWGVHKSETDGSQYLLLDRSNSIFLKIKEELKAVPIGSLFDLYTKLIEKSVPYHVFRNVAAAPYEDNAKSVKRQEIVLMGKALRCLDNGISVQNIRMVIGSQVRYEADQDLIMELTEEDLI